MDIFSILTMVGGLALFLYGMHVMGEGLSKASSGRMERILETLTSNPIKAVLLGTAVTAVIQSSSATTVMVVGFVNSGIMKLSQAIGIIMGANIGTTVTSWLLSLTGIESSSFIMQFLKPTSFSPILAIIGVAMIMFAKNEKKKDVGTIMIGFAVLMFGMDTMSGAVKPLADVPEFTQFLTMFSNPILGLLAGAILTAVIQSSSASVGILQALCVTGSVTFSSALPIIMGQNIGTCITAILSSFGANKNAKRASLVHLSFNVIGTIIGLVLFTLIKSLLQPVLFNEAANHVTIAIAHSVFNVLCTVVLLPASALLEKLALRLIPDKGKQEVITELDERLLATPSLAIQRCNALVIEMAENAVNAFKNSLLLLKQYDAKKAEQIRKDEARVDHLEDILGTYLVKLSAQQVSDTDSIQISKLLKAIGDFERISDHSVNVVESAEELHEKEIKFSDVAQNEMNTLSMAVAEILDLASMAFIYDNLDIARKIEPLEQVIDDLKTKMRDGHIARLQTGECSIGAGFVWTDLLTNLERTADHCSNVAVCTLDAAENNMNIHESLANIKQNSPYFKEEYEKYQAKYSK